MREAHVVPVTNKVMELYGNGNKFADISSRMLDGVRNARRLKRLFNTFMAQLAFVKDFKRL